MVEARVLLRASTLLILLTTTGGYSFLPHSRPLARSLHGHRHCGSAISRTRLAPPCAIAVGRGNTVDEKEGESTDRRSSSDTTSDHAHDTAAAAAAAAATAATAAADGAAAAEGSSSRGEWYGVQEQNVVASSTPPAGEKGSGTTAAAALSGAGGATTTTRPKRGGEKKPKSGKKGKGAKGTKTNPSIGKSNLDTIIGDSAKSGVFIGGDPEKVLFGGEPETAQSSSSKAKAKAKAEALAAATAAASEVEEEEEEGDEARVSFSARWRRRITFAARTVQIWAFLFHVLIKLLRQKLVQMDEARMSARRRKLGRYLCRAFLKLGPTFIKIGQLLSTRVDLLSTEYIEELQQLQDDVPGFGGAKAVSIIEKELGAPIDQLFDKFNSTSLAAASLGQVHEAWLDGKRYAVKVQRPGLKRLFEVDLNSIGALAGILDRFDPKLDGASRDWGAIFRESSRVLYEEVDYTREGKNAERFSENFKGTEWIKAPGINWSRSSSKVLCMEYVQGIKINNVEAIEKAGVDRALLATRTAECYLEQLIRHGFFHCDPHPGNLACDAVDGGRIIFYDFGMMDELTVPLKRAFSDLIFGIYGNDLTEVVDSLEEMDVIRKGADRMTVERVTRFYLGEFQTTLTKGGKYINQLDPEEEKALIRRERAQIGQDLFSGQAAVPLQFPASFTFVFRAFTTLDGIGKTLDKGYDLTKIAGPYLKELLDLKDGNAYVSYLKSLQKKLGWRGQDVASVVQSPRRVQHVENVVTKLETGDLKLRVRVLESEQAFARIEAVQGSLSSAVMATLLLNAGVLMAGQAAGGAATLSSRAMFVLAGFFGIQIPAGYFKVWRLNRQASTSKGFR